MNLIERVQEMYAEFSRGNVDGILQHFDENIEWEYGYANPAALTYLQPRQGRAQTREFFAALNDFDFQRFNPHTYLTTDRTVVVLLDIELTVKTNGNRITELDEVHIWHFNERDLVQRFKHKFDVYNFLLGINNLKPGFHLAG